MMLQAAVVVLAFSARASSIRISEHCEAPALTDFDKYTHIFCPEESEVHNAPIVFDSPLPDYLSGGKFVVSGMGSQSVGSKKSAPEFLYYMDGFMKMHTVTIGGSISANSSDGGGAETPSLFSARMMNTNWFERSVAEGTVAAGSTFYQTDPKRTSDRMPMLNMQACTAGNCDNSPVVAYLLPDGETLVYATDKSDPLVVDLEALNTTGVLAWEDDLAMPGSPAASHTLADPSGNGGIIGLVIPPPSVSEAIVYRVAPGAPRVRVEVGRVGVRQGLYDHAFGLTKAHAVVVEHPVSVRIKTLLTAKPLIDAFEMDNASTTKIHTVDLASGEVATFDAGHPFMLMHVGNSYEDESTGIITFDAECFDMTANPFGFFLFDSILDESFVPQLGSTYRRYTLDPSTGVVSFKELLAPQDGEGGTYGFTKINDAWAGAKNCFTYITHFGPAHTASVVKYDHCAEAVVGEWAPAATYPTEMVFVGDPARAGSGGQEDAGVLVGITYDASTMTSSFTVVDAVTMTTLAAAALPFRVPYPLHGTFLAAH